jgi:mannosyl-3-phosphoglycerate phosphatase
MKLIVFTDLDATLLDARTYSWRPAAPALLALKERGAAVVLVSSKTLAEMVPLHAELGLVDPFVVENGGGIVTNRADEMSGHLRAVVPSAAWTPYGDRLVISLGMEYKELVESLAGISSHLGIKLVGFADMSAAEISELTGLTLSEAEKARQRLFDEPFVVAQTDLHREPEIIRAAEARGLTAVQGGRFLHLIGHSGKGKAVSLLIKAFCHAYGEVLTIGLGDSPNDYPFLELVDTAVIVGGVDAMSKLPDTLSSAIRTTAKGPVGWNEAILGILADLGR